MDIKFYQDEDETEDMTLESESSTTNTSNTSDTSKTAPKINRGDKFDATEKILNRYYDAKIDHNNHDFPMIR